MDVCLLWVLWVALAT